ncbi:MAG: hypothetical protein LBT05_00725 [Planctomycetaceae bacterium]|nr:hypothetical protein [Planctomycetaceae bacterium]
MKEKQTHPSQPVQKTNSNDPWTTLQMQLGLLTSPIEHEPVSIVSAVVPKETLQEENNLSEITHNNAKESPRENDNQTQIIEEETNTVSVTIQVPINAETRPIVSETEKETKTLAESTTETKVENEVSFLDFGDLGDTGIPQFAFSKPRATRNPTEKLPEPVTKFEVTNHDFLSENPKGENLQTSFAEKEPLESEKEKVFDPLATEELPTLLWQPKKIVATPPQSSQIASFSDNLTQQKPETTQPLAETPLSGFKRRESNRQENRREKFAPSSAFESSEDIEIERPTRGSRPPQKKSYSPQRKPVLEEDAVLFEPEEKAAEEFVARPKSQRPTRDSRPQRFQRNPKTEDISSEQTSYRDDSEPEKRNFSSDNSRIQEIPTHAQYEEFPQKRAKERERTVTKPRIEQRNSERSTDSAMPSPAPQKLIVPGWDDAVGGIIEKNMARRNNFTSQSSGASSSKNPNYRPKKRQ